MQATIIRATVHLRVVHALQHRTFNLAAAAGIDNSCDATHGVQEWIGWACIALMRPNC